MLICDTHLHSSFSSDSDTPMEQMILQGISLGLQTLCFTEHYDYDYPDNPEGLDFMLDFDAYYHTFLTLKEKYHSQIELLHGLELGVQHHIGPASDEFFRSYGNRFDFIINSCHLVDKMDPYDGIYFQQYSPTEGIRKYFENILTNFKVFPYFQTAGHLDYICRYLPAPRPEFMFCDYQDIIDDILKYLVKHEKGLEVNTAGLKAGLDWPNPHIDILKRYKELGGEIITIGSDAHKPQDMAYAFKRLPDILKAAGFRHYAVYRKKIPEFYTL